MFYLWSSIWNRELSCYATWKENSPHKLIYRCCLAVVIKQPVIVHKKVVDMLTTHTHCTICYQKSKREGFWYPFDNIDSNITKHCLNCPCSTMYRQILCDNLLLVVVYYAINNLIFSMLHAYSEGNSCVGTICLLKLLANRLGLSIYHRFSCTEMVLLKAWTPCHCHDVLNV